MRLLGAMLLLAPSLLLAQDCDAPLGQRALSQARRFAAVGDYQAASASLRTVTRECPASPQILRAVVEIYDEIGDKRSADQWRTHIARFEHIATAGSGAASTSGVPAQRVSAIVRRKHALIVGVGTFQSPRVPALRFAAKDAKDFAAVLLDPSVGRFKPGDVRLLTDSEATVSAVRSALDDIARQSESDDLVLLYFSTHGTNADMDDVMEAGRSGYIVLHETDPGHLYGTAFSMSDLARVIDQRIKAHRVIAFMDTCYSGEVQRGRGGKSIQSTLSKSQFESLTGGSKALVVDPAPNIAARGTSGGPAPVAQEAGRVVVTSSQPNEQSWESETLGNGSGNSYFTYYLIEAMRRSGKGNTAPDLPRLYEYLRDKVREAVRKEKKTSQTPMLLSGGSVPRIVIGTPLP